MDTQITKIIFLEILFNNNFSINLKTCAQKITKSRAYIYSKFNTKAEIISEIIKNIIKMQIKPISNFYFAPITTRADYLYSVMLFNVLNYPHIALRLISYISHQKDDPIEELKLILSEVIYQRHLKNLDITEKNLLHTNVLYLHNTILLLNKKKHIEHCLKIFNKVIEGIEQYNNFLYEIKKTHHEYTS